MLVNYEDISSYLNDKCIGHKNPNVFWDAVKPLVSDKCKGGQNNIVLSEDGAIVNDQGTVCKVFNAFFNAVADNVGQNPNEIVNYQNENDLDGYVAGILQRYESHSSVKAIKQRGIPQGSFDFQPVSAEDIKARLEKLKTKKASGCDYIPAKLLKIGASVLCYPIQQIANMCIEMSLFPASLKRAEITPIHKKNDTMLKENYRPVSDLHCQRYSKVFL